MGYHPVVGWCGGGPPLAADDLRTPVPGTRKHDYSVFKGVQRGDRERKLLVQTYGRSVAADIVDAAEQAVPALYRTHDFWLLTVERILFRIAHPLLNLRPCAKEFS